MRFDVLRVQCLRLWAKGAGPRRTAPLLQSAAQVHRSYSVTRPAPTSSIGLRANNSRTVT